MATRKKTTAKKKSPEFIFHVVKWNEDGSKKLVSKKITVKRATLNSARSYMTKKYPRPYFFELYSSKFPK